MNATEVSSNNNNISRRLTMSSSEVLNPVAVILGLIKCKDWRRFRTLIAVSSPDCFRDMASSISTYSEQKLNSMTLLHVVVRDNPPLDIVGNIIKICPELAAARDDLGRTPLHIAAGSEASPLLLKFIACSYPAACDTQDEDGKTPLHFVCDTSFGHITEVGPSFTPNHQTSPKHEAIVALLSESLNAAAIEDDDGMSPLEHAIMCEASLETVRLLQASARESLKSRVQSVSPIPGTNERRRASDAFEVVTNCSENLQGMHIKKN